ncbi:MAG: hypothetical protein UDB11_01805 [Peptococcaceae bacterium]|nr:hypothetical protein [Peptococcaceae bacterium]
MEPVQFFWLLLGLLLGIVVVRYALRQKKRYERRQISRRAQQGEAEAEKLLQRAGYTILDAQVRRPVVMTVDGERIESYIKADYLVAKKGKDYLVEVKTGKQANVRLPQVRRQLFEYQNIFRTDGILFIDMNKYDMMEVSFDDLSQTPRPMMGAFLAGLLVGVCLMVFIYSYQ